MKNVISNPNDNDEEGTEGWAERGDYWLQQATAEPKYHDRIKRTLNLPLILSGHGARLRIDRGTLLVRGGFTHHPQEQEEYRFFPRDKRLPSRIVILDGDGGISFDALEWLATQAVPLIQINWRGEVISSSGGFGYSADLEIMKAQLEIQNNAEKFQFSNHLILQKIENSIATLGEVFPSSPATQFATAQMQKKVEQLKNNLPTNFNTLRGIEGLAACVYFKCWHSYQLQWKTGRKLIPDDWRRIGARPTTLNNNQFARHPVNAMLNYGYAVLQNQVQAIIVAMGFDPTIGCMHGYEAKRPALVFDLMEPLRPIIDLRILTFIRSHTFSPNDFVLSKMGVCKLHPQFARVLVKLVQDISEIEAVTADNLKRLLALHPPAAKKAGKNIAAFKARAVGKRE